MFTAVAVMNHNVGLLCRLLQNFHDWIDEVEYFFFVCVSAKLAWGKMNMSILPHVQLAPHGLFCGAR